MPGRGLLFLSLCALGCGSSAPEAPPELAVEEAPEPEPAFDLRAALDSPDRPEEDRARDSQRHPADVLQFCGIEQGMKVIELLAFAGYYTEVLSIAVGSEGSVGMHQAPKFMEQGGERVDAIKARAERLKNVTLMARDVEELASGGPYDVAFTALNFHDLYFMVGKEATEKAVADLLGMLEPGGVLCIIDHHGDGLETDEKHHRIKQEWVLELMADSGFELEAESDLLSHPDDDRTRSVFDPEVRGETDRFLLRYRKPAG